jgi:hypothetical protein
MHVAACTNYWTELCRVTVKMAAYRARFPFFCGSSLQISRFLSHCFGHVNMSVSCFRLKEFDELFEQDEIDFKKLRRMSFYGENQL